METDLHQQSDSAFKRSNIKSASSETKNTCVILVCIQNLSGVQITHDLLYTIFSPYGKILRVTPSLPLCIYEHIIEILIQSQAILVLISLVRFLFLRNLKYGKLLWNTPLWKLP